MMLPKNKMWLFLCLNLNNKKKEAYPRPPVKWIGSAFPKRDIVRSPVAKTFL
jgi:hypothetical protein